MQFFLSFVLVISFGTFQLAFGDDNKVGSLADGSKQDQEVAEFATMGNDDEQDDDTDDRWVAPEMVDDMQKRSQVSQSSAGEEEAEELKKNKNKGAGKKNKNENKNNKPPKKKFKNKDMKLWVDGVGCFKDKGVLAWKDPSIRAIETLYKNLRKRKKIHWGWDDRIEEIMECSQAAQARGFACYAVEYYGECWGAIDACATYARYANSSNCIDGVGRDWTLFVYRAKCGSVFGCCPDGAMPAYGPNFEGCPDCTTAVDVVFVIDSSGSIGEENFVTVKEAIDKLIRHFSVSAIHARIGIVQYATEARVIYSLRQSQRLGFHRLARRVKNLFYTKGATKTGKGLELAYKMLLRSKRRLDGQILNHEQVVCVLTDGLTNDDDQANLAVSSVDLKSIARVVAVGVAGKDYTRLQRRQQRAELGRIASSPKDRFFEMSFKDLKDHVDPIARRACPVY